MTAGIVRDRPPVASDSAVRLQSSVASNCDAKRGTIAMADAVRVSQYGPRLELQVQGRGNMQQCPALRRWVEERVDRGCTRVWIDLSRTTHLDSTFIGTLLILNRRLLAGGGERIMLAAPSAACAPLLSQMHVQNQFVVSNDSVVPRHWQDELRVEGNTLSSYGFK